MKTAELLAYGRKEIGAKDITIKFFRILDEEGYTSDKMPFVVTSETDSVFAEHGECEAKFERFTDAKTFFKTMIVGNEITTVFLKADEFATYDEETDYDEEVDEYYDACLASKYGDNNLMNRYNRKHGIEKDYGPSNPWDAPGMSIHDFI